MSAVNASPEVGRSVVAAGIRTNYHDLGQGSPVLLLHGSGPGVSAWANWRAVLPTLSSQRRVIAPDLVGFGYSDRPAGHRYGLDSWVEHAVGLLDALALPTVDLVGNSFGGALALAVAIRHPTRVRRLVLMGSAGLRFTLTPALDQVWGYQPSFEAMRTMMDLFAFDRGLVTDALAQLRYEASLRPGVQDAYAAMFPAPRQNAVDGLASDEAQIAALSNETLVLRGREDRVIPLETSLRLASLIPKAQLHVFGQCGHWTQIEHAARFAKLVDSFLAEADASSPTT